MASEAKKQFNCEHCGALIEVPFDLPPTTAPCPVCQQATTSPALPNESSFNQENSPDRETARPGDHGSGQGWWAVAAVVFFALLAAAFFVYRNFKVESTPLSNGLGRSLEAGENPYSGGIEKEGLRVLEQFLSAESVENKAQFVIGKSDLLPEMTKYYGEGDLREEMIRAEYFSEWAMNSFDKDRGIFLLNYERPKQFRLSELFSPITDLRTHLLLQEPDLQTRARSYRSNFEMEAEQVQVYFKWIDGELLMDWHTYVQTKDRTLRAFTNFPAAGREMTFRVFASEDVSGLLDPEKKSFFFRFSDPAFVDEDYVVVRVDRGTKEAKILEPLIWSNKSGVSNTKRTVTVVLRWTNEAQPELELAEILCWEFLGVGGDPSNLTTTE